MNRRLTLGTISFLLVAVVAACESYETDDVAATVNGHELSLEQLDELAEGNDDPAVLRATLTAWIQVVAASEDPGELLTEEALAAQRELVIPPMIEAAQQLTQELYETGLEGSPLLCMAVIPLEADTPAVDVLAELRTGTSFAEAATTYSADAALADVGGIISVDGQECLPTNQWNVELLAELTDNGAKVGTPVVISLNAAEVIAVLRPFDELDDASKSLLAQGPVSDALRELYQAADIQVNEKIGTWDNEQVMVVAARTE